MCSWIRMRYWSGCAEAAASSHLPRTSTPRTDGRSSFVLVTPRFTLCAIEMPSGSVPALTKHWTGAANAAACLHMPRASNSQTRCPAQDRAGKVRGDNNLSGTLLNIDKTCRRGMTTSATFVHSRLDQEKGTSSSSKNRHSMSPPLSSRTA